MKRNTDKFDYFYSKVLKQEFAINKKTGMVTFQDGIKYTHREVEKLKGASDDAIKKTHMIKKKMPGSKVVK